AVWEKLSKENPAVVVYRLNIATICADIACTLQAMDQNTHVSDWYTRARSLLEQVVKDDPAAPRPYNALGKCLDALSEIQYQQKQFTEAEQLLQAAITAQQRSLELAPAMEQSHRYLSTHWVNLARVYAAMQKPDEAIDAAQQAVTQANRLVALPTSGVSGLRQLVSAHASHAHKLYEAGHKAKALD
ncbi:MAG TPA: tetratricopeptide repeat protein, partial [Gemmatales bacterium]|nr:tetratricopeptide repeat protein [Gemmatales bacterium]